MERAMAGTSHNMESEILFHHYGVDILASKGTKVSPVLSGEVVEVVDTFSPGEYQENSFGNYVIIKSRVNDENVFTKFAHLDKVSVTVGDPVGLDSQLGEAGNTGNAAYLPADENHVHIEASKGGNFFSGKNRVNPENYFSTKFDSQGRPMNPKTLTPSEVRELVNYLNKIAPRKNTNQEPLKE